jgi:putative hydrolase of the HAD superfamily
MQSEFEAIFIDLGNTMRVLVKDEEHQSLARKKIAEMVGCQESPEALCQLINERYKTYRKWAFQTMIEAPEPAEVLAPIATELTFQFRQSMGKRVLQKDARQVVVELDQRGYRLGIISNLISTQEIPDWLEADGFNPYFKSVVLSSVLGRRKPDPEVYWEAARRIGIAPAKCVYVGDNPARDVVGTRNAGFGMIILLMDQGEVEKDPPQGENKPDQIIYEFKQLLDIFPAK